MTALQHLASLGLTRDEAESLELFLQQYRREYRSGIAAWLQRCAVNTAGAIITAKDSDFTSPRFSFEMGRARAFCDVAAMLDNLYSDAYGDKQWQSA